MLELIEVCDRPPIFGRAEPDDEYPRPEPLDPNLIDKYQYPEDHDEDADAEDDENDERNYSS